MIDRVTENIGEVTYVHNAEFLDTEIRRGERMAKFHLVRSGPLWMDWNYYNGVLLTTEDDGRVGIQGRRGEEFDINRLLVGDESARRFVTHWLRECPKP